MGITCDATLSAFARLAGRPVEEAASPTPVLAGAAGTAGAYRRTAWEQVGGLDEAFPAYQEDFELALRLRAAGWETTAAPAARCTHLGSASYVARSARSRFNGGFGRGYVLRRYGALTPARGADRGDRGRRRHGDAARPGGGARPRRGLARRRRPAAASSRHAVDSRSPCATRSRCAAGVRRGAPAARRSRPAPRRPKPRRATPT